MAQLTNSMATFNAAGLREQLANEIYNVSPEEAPFLAMIGKEKANGVLEEWQTDSLRAAGANKREQGNEAAPTQRTPTKRVGNRTQISDDTYAVTGTQEAVEKAGRKSEIAYQDSKIMLELKKDVEFGAMQNTTSIAAAAGVAPQARGLLGWLATNTNIGAGGINPNPDANTAPTDGTLRVLTEAMLKDVAQKCWSSGGNPDRLFVPAALRATVDGFTGGATKFDKTEDKTLHATVEVYVGPFGRYSVINSRHQRDRDVFLLDTSMFALMTLRPMKGKDLAETGDSKKRLINTEWTFKSKNEAASGVIRDLQPAA